MKQITREHFVEIVYNSIVESKNEIAIVNQLNGYRNFHKEVRDNDFINKFRDNYLSQTQKNDHLLKFKFIKFFGLGHCQELAYYLSIKIADKINKAGAVAKMQVVGSKSKDHSFVRIQIKLLNEKYFSLWEADAWDPRIMDISESKDGKVNNIKHLSYGYLVTVDSQFKTNKIFSGAGKKHFIEQEKIFKPLVNLEKPKKGRPERSPTPTKDMLQKHDYLYHNYTIEKALKKQKLCISPHLYFFQQARDWQKHPQSNHNSDHINLL